MKTPRPAAKPPTDRAALLPLLGEVFRAHGYEGASLALISEATGLGKGSLYHYFPGGKKQMAEQVLAEIDGWFDTNIFAPLRDPADPQAAIEAMLSGVDAYFRSGARVCLVGVLALGHARDEFVAPVNDYFARWQDALAAALRRCGLSSATARRRAEDAVLSIQGALVLARARDDAKVFSRALAELKARLLA
ncbi:TetR/AcrR family transcriptional regulator [Rhodopseudomonas palustris]|uniref:TetR/AcrR family transcriptional regulator n=1 Tax=Rhodopseudomonas palustris TaxID=1076 RepID=A0A418UYT9_RHOPL|nr:TetR/AcrR family transcriptional regulator [Rhodopseudomonas palustris]RJF68422.1 TetR/AcrR family transcriptional regulator [Rhodopseudomonas palustris]